jgi:hypothetical protein
MYKELTVESFCNTIMLGSVMGGEVALSALGIQVSHEFVAGVLAAIITAKLFDLGVVLSLHPGFKILVGSKVSSFDHRSSTQA